MKLVFSDQPIPKNIVKSMFLAGPSPRELSVSDWRVKALEYLESINFNGTVFLPIPEGRFYGKADSTTWSYNNQVNWECEARNVADIILFWVPRSLSGKMPGFVTNIEFGEDLSSGKIVYGRPVDAEKCKYLDKRFEDLNYQVHETLEDTLNNAVELLGDGSYRENGEVYVPLFIWKTPQFQSWYKNLILAGNSLMSAKVLYHFKLRNGQLFSYNIKVKIWVESEKREKPNEIIFARTDTVHAVLYYKDGVDTKVVLIKEFRSPVNNELGYVYELPGGSSLNPELNSFDILLEEVKEEVGFEIEDVSRFKLVSHRQSVATISTHRSFFYKLELSKEEYNQILLNNEKSFGNQHEGEITYIQVIDSKELSSYPIDYSILGMLYLCFN